MGGTLKINLSSQKKTQLVTWISITSLTAIALFIHYTSTSTPSKQLLPMSPDTHIPVGWVLVPIELANARSLDPLIGNFGVIDLYAPQSSGLGKAKKIASQIKIIRAPLNPQTFAVLVPETEAQNILAIQTPMTGAIQNPDSRNSDFRKEVKNGQAIQIEYN